MNTPRTVGVLGAGIVGLSTALTLQHAGFNVTIFDKAEPGNGASFGNAGIFADYARLPMSSFSNLIAMPSMLLDSESPLSIKKSYLSRMLPYGYRFAMATLPTHYKKGGDVLTDLSELSLDASEKLWNIADAHDLIGTCGCLALYGSEGGISKGLAKQMAERQSRGVPLAYLNPKEVHDLEPDLLPFYTGGIHYKSTKFAKSPIHLSHRYFGKFLEMGGQFIQTEVSDVKADEQHAVVSHAKGTDRFDAIVLAAGVSSRELAKRLGSNMPLVSERGYHLMVDAGERRINRPVVWLDRSVFLTPMNDGVRVAGTAEFAFPDDTPSATRSDLILRIARTMFGDALQERSEWVGSRPSMPDSLPVIGYSPKSERVIFAFGHGHLGLSLSAATGALVCQMLEGQSPHHALKALSPARFAS